MAYVSYCHIHNIPLKQDPLGPGVMPCNLCMREIYGPDRFGTLKEEKEKEKKKKSDSRTKKGKKKKQSRSSNKLNRRCIYGKHSREV